MNMGLRFTLGVAACLMGAVAIALPVVRAAADTSRTVYMSAFDQKGEIVTDLTPADLVVKENNQVRQVTSLSHATEPNHVALIVDDGGDGTLRAPVVEFLNAATNVIVSMRMLSPQALVLNDYSTDRNTIQQSILRLVERGRAPADTALLSDAISSAAREMIKRKLSRPAIVVLTTGGEGVEQEVARGILADIRDSGASLHVVRVVNSDAGTVLNDGPEQSGGSTEVAASTKAFSDRMKAIARTLSYQYKLDYVLPDGVKPNDRLQVTTTRAGVKIVAPTRIATK
jgi:hypothetical protein